MTTNVYVDGFNLYNGCIKGTKYKWLDLRAFAQDLLGRAHAVGTVRYFTSRVIDSTNDPHQSQRQEIYLRALTAHAQVDVHLGFFRTREKRVMLVTPRPNGDRFDLASVREEKGTDVKFATNLVWDSFHDREMTGALIISNDSDLQESIDMARQMNKTVITVNPHHVSGQGDHLHGNDRRIIDQRHLARNQLPTSVADSDGRRHRKPPRW